MSEEPQISGDYEDRLVLAAYSVLIELGQVLGEYRDKIVIVGGSVPWLVYQDADPAYVGTLDVDLGMDPVALSEGEYARLVETLEAEGYERGGEDLKCFQLRRAVGIDDHGPIEVLVDLLASKEMKFKGSRPPRIEGLRVQQIPGCKIALTENVLRRFQGRMPDGRNNSTRLRIATIPALLVMKGYALDQRSKRKDAYDIYYSMRHHPAGVVALAEDCRHLLEDDIAVEAFRLIRSKFRKVDDYGPETVVGFVEGRREVLTGFTEAEQVQVDAFRQVDAFLNALGFPVGKEDFDS